MKDCAVGSFFLILQTQLLQLYLIPEQFSSFASMQESLAVHHSAQ